MTLNSNRNRLAGISAAAALLSSLALPAAVSAAPRSNGYQLVPLAHRLLDLTKELREEFNQHFRGTDVYRYLVADVAAIDVKARHIDELTHDPEVSSRHLDADLSDLERTVSRLRERVNRIPVSGRVGFSGRAGASHLDDVLRQIDGTIDAMDRVADNVRSSSRDYGSSSWGSRGDDHDHDRDRGPSNTGSGRTGRSLFQVPAAIKVDPRRY